MQQASAAAHGDGTTASVQLHSSVRLESNMGMSRSTGGSTRPWLVRRARFSTGLPSPPQMWASPLTVVRDHFNAGLGEGEYPQLWTVGDAVPAGLTTVGQAYRTARGAQREGPAGRARFGGAELSRCGYGRLSRKALSIAVPAAGRTYRWRSNGYGNGRRPLSPRLTVSTVFHSP
jgi:hypothetical protein